MDENTTPAEPPIEMMESNHNAVILIEDRGATADIALENLDEKIREHFRRWSPIADVGVCMHTDVGGEEYFVATVRMVRPVTLHRWRDPIADAF